MANLTRRDAEERRLGLLNWFLAHPDATGTEAQIALISGRVTGKRGPGMSIHTVHALQRQAEGMRRQGARASVPAGERIEGEARKRMRDLAVALQAALAQVPDVESLVVDRLRVVVRRPSVEEEDL